MHSEQFINYFLSLDHHKILNSFFNFAGKIFFGLFLILNFLAMFSVCHAANIYFPLPEKEWTIIVYLDADNNLEEELLEDLYEMEKGVHDQVNIVALVDRSKSYSQAAGNWTGAKLFFVQKNNSNSEKLPDRFASLEISDMGEIDMSDPANIAGLLNAAIRNAPARHYEFMVSNHGGGWKNLLNDDDGGNGNPGKYFMTIQEFAKAVKTATGLLPRGKFDIIHFDLCLMGQLDVLMEMYQLTDYVLASPPIELGMGLDYSTVLKYYNSENSPRDIALKLAQNYVNNVQAMSSKVSATMSVYDVSKMPVVVSCLQQLASNLISIVPKSYSELSKSMVYATSYESISNNIKAMEKGVWSVSLPDWLRKLQMEVPGVQYDLISNVQSALNQLIVGKYSTSSGKSMEGVGIYLPIRREFLDKNYNTTSFANLSNFGSFLEALYQVQKNKGQQKPTFSNVRIGSYKLKPGRDGRKGDDFIVTPKSVVTPLTKNVIQFDVAGQDILWTGISQFENRNNKKYITTVALLREVFDPSKLGTAGSEFSLVSPKYNNGTTTLIREITGVKYLVSNGREMRDITIYAMFSNPLKSESVIQAVYTDSNLGGKEIIVEIPFESDSYYLKSGVVTAYNMDGSFYGKYALKKSGVLRTYVEVVNEKGESIRETTQPMTVGDNLYLVPDFVGDNAKIGFSLFAETISGVNSGVTVPGVNIKLSRSQKEMLKNTKNVIFSKKGRSNLYGSYALMQYVTSGNNVDLVSNFRNITFTPQDNGGLRWEMQDANKSDIASGRAEYTAEGIPYIVLFSGRDVVASWSIFLEGMGPNRMWYLIENGIGTRWALVPLESFSEKDLNGEWRSPNEIIKFDHGKIFYKRTKENQQFESKGMYYVEGNLIRLRGYMVDEYAYYIDRKTQQLYLSSRDHVLTTLKRIGDPVPPISNNSNDSSNNIPDSSGGNLGNCSGIEGEYTGGADSGFAQMKIERNAGGNYHMLLKTTGQGITEAMFYIQGNQMVASFRNGTVAYIGFQMSNNTLQLYFPNMPPLNLQRRSGLNCR